MKKIEWIIIAFSMIMLLMYTALIVVNGLVVWTGIAIILALGCVATIVLELPYKRSVTIAWLSYYCLFSGLGLISKTSLFLMDDGASMNYVEVLINAVTFAGAVFLLLEAYRFKVE